MILSSSANSLPSIDELTADKSVSILRLAKEYSFSAQSSIGHRCHQAHDGGGLLGRISWPRRQTLEARAHYARWHWESAGLFAPNAKSRSDGIGNFDYHRKTILGQYLRPPRPFPRKSLQNHPNRRLWGITPTPDKCTNKKGMTRRPFLFGTSQETNCYFLPYFFMYLSTRPAVSSKVFLPV